VKVFHPGTGFNAGDVNSLAPEELEKPSKFTKTQAEAQTVLGFILNIIPQIDGSERLPEGEIIQVLFIAVFFGLALVVAWRRPIVQSFNALEQVYAAVNDNDRPSVLKLAPIRGPVLRRWPFGRLKVWRRVPLNIWSG